MDILVEARTWIVVFALTLPRILAAFIPLPFFSPQMLPGMIRNGLAMVFALSAAPLVYTQYGETNTMEGITFLIILKEIFIGFTFGYTIAIVFWAITSMGFILDTQRGAMSATFFSASAGGQTSPLGAFFTQIITTLFFTSGAFLLMLEALLLSYAVWPVTSFLPSINPNAVDYFLSQFGLMMHAALLMAAPAMIVMFLIEFGMALIGRFAPQINIFLLAMPIKSAVVLLVLILYTGYIVKYVLGEFNEIRVMLIPLEKLFK